MELRFLWAFSQNYISNWFNYFNKQNVIAVINLVAILIIMCVGRATFWYKLFLLNIKKHFKFLQAIKTFLLQKTLLYVMPLKMSFFHFRFFCEHSLNIRHESCQNWLKKERSKKVKKHKSKTLNCFTTYMILYFLSINRCKLSFIYLFCFPFVLLSSVWTFKVGIWRLFYFV